MNTSRKIVEEFKKNERYVTTYIIELCRKGRLSDLAQLPKWNICANSDYIQAAIQGGHLDVLKFLIGELTNYNCFGYISQAISYGHFDITKYFLLSFGHVYPNSCKDWFQDACIRGYIQIALLLLDHFNPKISDVCIYHPAIIKKLLEKGHVHLGKKASSHDLMGLLIYGYPLGKLIRSDHYCYFLEKREEKKEIIESLLRYFLIDDLLGVVLGFALWVTG